MRMLFLGFFASIPFFTFAFTEPDTLSAEDVAAMDAYLAYIDSVSASLNYQTGQVDLRSGLATLTLPEGYTYIDADEAEIVLVDLWGNPPGDPSDRSLGMIFPPGGTATVDSTYAINITFVQEGYIDDSDAKDLDFTALLKDLKESTSAGNEDRMALGYEPVYVVDWATPPFYDAADKKIHWALKLQFGTEETQTLNYNIRVLGRRGYLRLNVIGDMSTLDQVNQDISDILSSVAFQEGHRYEDFDSKLDDVAAYGIGGLIAGTVLAKAGFFAKIGILLVKFWKILALAVVGGLAAVRRIFRKKEEA
ncbi:MAG: DUF2167 domain-containing protein [Phaeodactylibacter sp.]|nr:DUF2167 domain-containing protein [Phaeodactylibacter sp.]